MLTINLLGQLELLGLIETMPPLFCLKVQAASKLVLTGLKAVR